MNTQNQSQKRDLKDVAVLIRNYRVWAKEGIIKEDGGYQDRLAIDDWHGNYVWEVAFYSFRSDRMITALVSPYHGIVVTSSRNRVFLDLTMDEVYDVARALGLLYLPATSDDKHGFGCWPFTYAGYVGHRCVNDDNENHQLFIISTGNAVYTAHVHHKDRRTKATIFKLRGATAEAVRTIFFTL